MPIVNPKTAETEESSEEILARLAKLRDTLDGVSTGDTIETTPTIEVIQTHPELTQTLSINGTPYPGIWVPNYPAFQIAVRELDDEYNCDVTSPHTGFSCTARRNGCDVDNGGSWAHVATPGKDFNPLDDDLPPDYDMVLEWWTGNASGYGLIIGQGAQASIEEDVYVPNFANGYVKTFGTNCPAYTDIYTCSLHDGHRYSHIAAASARTLQIWND